MKNITPYFLLLFISLNLLSACDEEQKLVNKIREAQKQQKINSPTPTGAPGSLDLSNYVALGGAYTAGFANGALYDHAQSQSYPALLARQFAVQGIGGGAFHQPDINAVNGFSSEKGGKIYGKVIANADSTFAPSVPGNAVTPYPGDKSQLNNLAAPYIKAAQMLTPLTKNSAIQNPAHDPYTWYKRMAAKPGTSLLDAAVAKKPTFFTIWAGMSDVLPYAMNGGEDDALLPDAQQVIGSIQTMAKKLLAVDAKKTKGVLINIPDVSMLAYFNTVKSRMKIPEKPAIFRDGLRLVLTPVNQAITAWNDTIRNKIRPLIKRPLFITNMEQYGMAIIDTSLPEIPFEPPPVVAEIYSKKTLVGARSIGEGERILFSLAHVLRQQERQVKINPSTADRTGAPIQPIATPFILDSTEVKKVQDRITNINQGIKAITDTEPRLALFDLHSLFEKMAQAQGYTSAQTGGFKLTPDLLPNGIYSNDGIHFNPRGAAILANEIIDVLKSDFGADIPKLDILQFSSAPFRQ